MACLWNKSINMTGRLFLYVFRQPHNYKLRNIHLLENTKQLTILPIKKFSKLDLPAICRNHYFGAPIKVKHCKNYYFIPLHGYGRASLKYERFGNLLTFKHTWIPEIARGRGLGVVLTRVALEHALEMGYLIKVNCNYVRYVIDNYAEEYKKLEIDFKPELAYGSDVESKRILTI